MVLLPHYQLITHKRWQQLIMQLLQLCLQSLSRRKRRRMLLRAALVQERKRRLLPQVALLRLLPVLRPAKEKQNRPLLMSSQVLCQTLRLQWWLHGRCGGRIRSPKSLPLCPLLLRLLLRRLLLPQHRHWLLLLLQAVRLRLLQFRLVACGWRLLQAR